MTPRPDTINHLVGLHIVLEIIRINHCDVTLSPFYATDITRIVPAKRQMDSALHPIKPVRRASSLSFHQNILCVERI